MKMGRVRVKELVRESSKVAVDMNRSFSGWWPGGHALIADEFFSRKTGCADLFVVSGEGEKSVFEFGALHIDRVQRRIESEELAECRLRLARKDCGELALDRGARDPWTAWQSRRGTP